LDKDEIMDIMKNYGKYKEEFKKEPSKNINKLLTG